MAFEGGVDGDRVRHPGRAGGTACKTDRGDVECERVLLCAGIWGPSVGALAGVPIPLLAVQHQLVWTDPIPELEGDTREVAHPILRHQDMAMYFRHRQDHYAVGNYQHEPIATPQSELRRPGDGALMPSLMPFTPGDFDVAEAEAARLLPALKGRMRPADPERSINGMFSFTPDAGSIVGESAKVRGVWLCEAVWVTHAGGFGRHVAEWMVQGEPSIDMAEADANRFYPYMTTPPFVLERGKQQYREVYDIIHPRQQMARPRKLRLSPFYERQVELGAEFVVGAGWERPEWFEANAAPRPDGRAVAAARRVGGAVLVADRGRRAPGDALERGAVRPHAVREVRRRGARRARVPRADLREPDRPTRSARSSTRRCSRRPAGSGATSRSRARSEELFRVVTGGGSGQHDLAWMRRQIRDGERVRITERTGSLFALGLWGPRAREILRRGHRRRPGQRRVPVHDGPVPERRRGRAGLGAADLATRASSGGSCTGSSRWATAPGSCCGRPAAEHGLVAAGLGAFDTLRLEKGYRFWGQDIHTEHDPFEAGLGFAVKMDKEAFQGREALERGSSAARPRKLACMTLDDPSRGRARQGADPVRRATSSATRRPPGTATRSGAASSTVTCPSSWRVPGHARSRSSTSTSGFRRRSPRTRCGIRRAND